MMLVGFMTAGSTDGVKVADVHTSSSKTRKGSVASSAASFSVQTRHLPPLQVTSDTNMSNMRPRSRLKSVHTTDADACLYRTTKSGGNP
jgi:hypothetical protein